MLPRIVLKPGKEKPLLRRHPWVFSGAVAETEGDPAPGDVGEAYSSGGEFLGTGHLNPRSQIVFRLLSRKKEAIGPSLFQERISAAAQWREKRYHGRTTAYRLVNAEGDLLPGLILDRYGETLVVQFLSAGMERAKHPIVEWLAGAYRPKRIYERSDAATREEEGLPPARGLLLGEDLSDDVEIDEYGSRFRVDVKTGQKTGFYLDQRENRQALKGVAKGMRILDCFCYTGAFSVQAARGGAAEVVMVDSSQEALDLAEIHFRLNRLEQIPRRLIRGNVFEILRSVESGFDVIVLDPPPFAKKKGHIERASKGYKDLNLQALRLLNSGGLLFTFSCSHHISRDLFEKILFAAALDSGRAVQRISSVGAPFDHPVSLYHPEGDYLKGAILRVSV